MTLIFESEESFLPDQSTSLTLTHELNLDPCSNFENIRTKSSNVDIILISKTKINSSFPIAQFKVGYTSYRYRNSSGEGILLYVREDIPSTLLNTELCYESFCSELNIRKKKKFSLHIKPNKNLISDHRKEIGKNLDSYSSKYDNFIFPGDLDTKTTESAVRGFYQIYGYENLIKYNGFFKIQKNPLVLIL